MAKISKRSRFVKKGRNDLKLGVSAFLKDVHQQPKFEKNRRGSGKKLSGWAWNDPIGSEYPIQSIEFE